MSWRQTDRETGAVVATSVDEALADTIPEAAASVSTATVRKCRRHQWVAMATAEDGMVTAVWNECRLCHVRQDPARSRRSRNNGKRGRAAELDAARSVGGRKVGPLGHPWDVEMAGYARLQVKKLATPPSLRFVAAELARIARAPGPEMPGFVWIEPGRGGERLIVFRLADFADRHGVPTDPEPVG
jgi:hypothetical protein